MIRKVFKPFIISGLQGVINKPISVKGDLEIRISFELTEWAYNKVFETFSTNKGVRKIGDKRFKPNCKNVDNTCMNNLIQTTSNELLNAIVNKLLNSHESHLNINVELVTHNIFIKGNYNKFSREIGQTPWEVNGVKICESSVEDEINKNMIQVLKADSAIMSAGGREDRDVRMLGQGRPFVMEIANPKKRFNILNNTSELEKLINESTVLVKVRNLMVCDKDEFAVIKKYEDSKHKLYTCFVWCSRTITEEDIVKINSVKDLDIIQKTPMRVMHRRTLMERKKIIYKLEGKRINDNFIV
jgi:tRNA pseudouridine synthase 10